MSNKWTTLYVKLDGQMKRIGNVNLSTRAISLYAEGYKYYESPDLYYADINGNYIHWDNN